MAGSRTKKRMLKGVMTVFHPTNRWKVDVIHTRFDKEKLEVAHGHSGQVNLVVHSYGLPSKTISLTQEQSRELVELLEKFNERKERAEQVE